MYVFIVSADIYITTFNLTNCTCNHKSPFVIVWCSSCMFRPLQGGHLQRNSCIVSSVEMYTYEFTILCYQLKCCWKLMKSGLFIIILDFLIIVCLVADKRLCHSFHLHSKGVMSLCFVSIFTLKWTVGYCHISNLQFIYFNR